MYTCTIAQYATADMDNVPAYEMQLDNQYM